MGMHEIENKLKSGKQKFSVEASSDFSKKVMSEIDSQDLSPERFNNKVSMLMRVVAIFVLTLGGAFYYSNLSNITTDPKLENQIVMHGNGLNHQKMGSNIGDINIVEEVELLKKDFGAITNLFSAYAEATF